MLVLGCILNSSSYHEKVIKALITCSLRSCRPSAYYTTEESCQVPFPTAPVNLPACSLDCFFIAERQAGELFKYEF